MKKFLALCPVAVLFAGLSFAQNNGLGDPNPADIGAESAMSALREVSVDKFEREGAWNVHISADDGVIAGRLFQGSPLMKEPLEDDEGREEEDSQVFGVKVSFFRRGINSFTIKSGRPLPIEGTVKTISLWICGRSQSHDMYVLVQDYFGSNFELYLGNLGFSGWKKLTCVVPPSPDGEHGIVQNSAYFGDKPGLRIIGFRIDCNPVQAKGNFYMYLDDLRAVTDLYDIENHDEDDMVDNW